MKGFVFKVQGTYSLVYEIVMTVSDRNTKALLQLPQKKMVLKEDGAIMRKRKSEKKRRD